MLLNPSLKGLVDINSLFVTAVVLLVILDLIALSFKLLKEFKKKKKKKLELFGSCAMKAKSDLGGKW